MGRDREKHPPTLSEKSPDMKKPLISAIVSIFCITAASAQTGDIGITRFEGKRITGIEVSHAFDITLKQGPSTGATVSVPSYLQDKLIFELNGTILKIGFKDMKDNRNNDRFRADITCTTLERVNLSGACHLDIERVATTTYLDMRLSGASRVENSGRMGITGNFSLRASGASEVELDMAVSSTARINLSGSSDIEFRGSAMSAYIESSGASKIDNDEFLCKSVDIKASGASHISVHASQTLNVSASGASQIYYIGSAKVNASTSGSSSIMSK